MLSETTLKIKFRGIFTTPNDGNKHYIIRISLRLYEHRHLKQVHNCLKSNYDSILYSLLCSESEILRTYEETRKYKVNIVNMSHLFPHYLHKL